MIEKEKKVTKHEIEDRLSRVGDYVKMDFLQSCLKKQLDFETRRFVLIKLAEIYDRRRMYAEAGRLLRIAAEITTTLDGKTKEYLKSMQLFVKSGNFDEADVSFSKALACGEGLQKERVKNARREAYKAQGEGYLEKDKRRPALEVYERYSSMELNIEEKRETQKILLELYNKLGKVNEYFNLKKTLDSN